MFSTALLLVWVEALFSPALALEPGLRFYYSPDEIRALANPTARNMQALLSNASPWICERSGAYVKIHSLHDDAAAKLRHPENSELRSSLEREFGVNAQTAKKKALDELDFNALVEVALHFRFTSAGRDAALTSAKHLLDHGNLWSSALLMKGLLNDTDRSCTQANRDVWEQASETFKPALFTAELAEAQHRLIECKWLSMTQADTDELKGIAQADTGNFMQVWREQRATPESPGRAIPEHLKVSLVFGFSGLETQQIFESHSGLTVCDHLDPRGAFSEMPDRTKHVLGAWKERFPLTAEAEIKLLISSFSNGRREQAVRSAILLGRLGDTSVPFLLAALSQKDENIRLGALDSLGQVGDRVGAYRPAVLAALDKVISEDTESLNEMAFSALVPLGKSAVPILRKSLRNGSENSRFQAVSAVFQLGSQAQAALPELEHVLSDSSERIRTTAISALGEMGEGGFPGVAKSLSSADAATRQTAAQVLGQMETVATEAAPHLISALSDPDGLVREHSTSALIIMGSGDPKIRDLIHYEFKRENNPKTRDLLDKVLCNIKARNFSAESQ